MVKHSYDSGPLNGVVDTTMWGGLTLAQRYPQPERVLIDTTMAGGIERARQTGQLPPLSYYHEPEDFGIVEASASVLAGTQRERDPELLYAAALGATIATLAEGKGPSAQRDAEHRDRIMTELEDPNWLPNYGGGEPDPVEAPEDPRVTILREARLRASVRAMGDVVLDYELYDTLGCEPDDREKQLLRDVDGVDWAIWDGMHPDQPALADLPPISQ